METKWTGEPVLQGVSQAAKILGVSRAWVYAAVDAGRLPHIRLSKKILINIPLAVEAINRDCMAGATNEQCV